MKYALFPLLLLLISLSPLRGDDGFLADDDQPASELQEKPLTSYENILASTPTITDYPDPWSYLYTGLSFTWNHHTGYAPSNVPGGELGVEEWRPGVKAFAGWRIGERVAVECGYYYLNRSKFVETGFTGSSHERSHAVSSTLLLYTPQISGWGLFNSCPSQLFARAGGVVKTIYHHRPDRSFIDTGLCYHIGFGVETSLTSWLFSRLEYEYISRLLHNPTLTVDVQHTPISVGLGVRY